MSSFFKDTGKIMSQMLQKPFPFYGRMEKKPMSQPRVAWEEDGAPQGSSSPVEPHKVTVVQPLQMGE
ncbi:hypothetical protein DV515_00017139 [Chloebia gouldiae]|uniref:Uncharacterized protein n=1 Tax=Chloebia gouldiae TaxID=44316 RepID=A0A3L8R0V5_CHLGU|nr:hypothetical protein DV515_00017142 [Chloebia gouldiae]RLV73215.1 hypothetical protein DV515_00017139 [Chloebia gouldiae]